METTLAEAKKALRANFAKGSSLIEHRFGRLTVTAKDIDGKYHCECVCGNKTSILRGNLVSGRQQSCGCLQKESIRAVGKRNKIHGETSSPEFRSWNSMLGRCYNKNNADFANYGGRGILVCDRWRSSFQDFLKDMDKRPSLRHTLDRKKNDGNYEPSNCRMGNET